jgi:pyruvate/2-oxoglutarate dehydrogenase complex dihydrolipoamide acyltransferase (E2) component
MLKAIEVPPLGEQKQTETLLNAWFVSVGQTVKAGDDIAELVTDKAAFNLPASEPGKIVKLLVREGDKIKPGDRLAEIETGG